MSFDLVFRVLNSIGNVRCIAVLFTVGVVCSNRNNYKLYEESAFLLLFVMIWNSLLKDIFQIPLEYASDTYAFPSGHAHASSVFYGTLFAGISDKRARGTLLLAIVLHGVGLVGCGYHIPMHVILTWPLAAFEVWLYRAAIRRYSADQVWTVMLGLCAVFMSAIYLIYTMLPHVWLVFYGMLGLICISRMHVDESSTLSRSAKAIVSVASIVLMVAIYELWLMLPFEYLCLSQLVGIVIFACPHAARVIGARLFA